MALSFGAVTLRHGLMLAPMAGVTDASFRAVCRRTGAEYTVSEMISAKGLCYEQRGRAGAPLRTAPLAKVCETDAPMAVQLFGREPDLMAEAARLLTTGTYRGFSGLLPVAVDINMGCPVAKIVSNGEGSALMREPELAAAIVSAVKRAVSVPVTVKMRAGFDAAHRNAPELAKRLEAAGADLLTVHGRTRDQFYAPASDPGVIAAVKRAVKIPVIGNGDIFTADDAAHILAETGCDGIMPARGTLGNPFLFAEITALLEHRPYLPPTPAERLQTALAQAEDMVQKKGLRTGMAEARKHMAWYCRGLNGAAAARSALMQAQTPADFADIFATLLQQTE